MSHVFLRRFPAVAVAVSAVLVVTLTGSPAHADRGGPKPYGPGEIDVVAAQGADGRQRRLTGLKTWILAQADLAGSGYIESVNDAAALSTALLWHGPADDLQRRIIAEGTRRGITVTVRQRRYSRDTLARTSEALAKRGDQAVAGFDVRSVTGISEDFDGIRVEGLPDAGAAKAAVSPQAAAAAFTESAAAQLGVDVRVVIGGGDDVAAATRTTDSPPFNAGGLMYSPGAGKICTTGFSVAVGGTRYTTTARHCLDHDFRPYGSSTYNYGDGVRNSSDGAGRQMSAKGSPLMFDGARNNTAGYKKTVIGFDDVSIGDQVCTSGANSGVHCAIRVSSLLHWFDDLYPHTGNSVFATIVGDQVSRTTAVCKGDSGGPVLTSVNGTQVRAVGMIQGAPFNNSSYLTSHPTWSGTAYCSHRVYFSSMRTIVNTLPSASLVTG